MTAQVHPVDEKLPTPRLAALGLQHVLVMYAGAIAVPLIVGPRAEAHPRAGGVAHLRRPVLLRHRHADPEPGRHAMVRHPLPVMMGVTFAAVGPMVAMAKAVPGGPEGARAIFGAIIGAGSSVDLHCAAGQPAAALLSAGGHRHHHCHHRHQPDARGHWLGAGRPGAPGAKRDVPRLGADGRRRWLQGRHRCCLACKLAGPIPMVDNPPTARSTTWRGGLRAGGDPAAGALHARLRRQHLGAAGHRGRLRWWRWRWAR
jgi:hypothetical protein